MPIKDKQKLLEYMRLYRRSAHGAAKLAEQRRRSRRRRGLPDMKEYRPRSSPRIKVGRAEYQREWRKRPEIKARLAERQKRYRSNPEVKKRYSRLRTEWEIRNKEKVKAKNRILSAKRRMAVFETDITHEFLRELWILSEFCLLCGKKMLDNSSYPDGKELDHITPICCGGKHLMSNVRYICAKCNRCRPKDGSDLIQPTS